MEPASAVAGLIGLAVLTAQTANKILRTIKGLQQISKRLNRHLQWLAQLAQLLAEINEACQTLRQSTLNIDATILESHLKECLTAMQALEEKIESHATVLQGSERLKRHITRIKAFLESGEVENQLEVIRRTMEGISICHSSIIMQGVVKSGDRLAAVEHLLQRQMADHDLFRLHIFNSLTRFHGHQDALENELKDICNRLALLQLDVAFLHTPLKNLQQRPGAAAHEEFSAEAIRIPFPEDLPSSGALPARDEQRYSDHKYNEPNRNLHISVEGWSRSRYQWKPVDATLPHRSVYYWSGKFFLGNWRVRVSEINAQSTSDEIREFNAEDLREIEMFWVPSILPRSRAFQMQVIYDRTHWLSSPTTFQIMAPRVRQIESVRSEVKTMELENFKVILRDEGYRPEDFFVRQSGSCWSLLYMAIAYGRMDIALYLLGQGWKPDKSNVNHKSQDGGWDLSALFDYLGREPLMSAENRQTTLSLLRRLLDSGASLPRYKQIGRVCLPWFDVTMNILLEHPACIMQYEMSTFGNCVDAIALRNPSADFSEWILGTTAEEMTQCYISLAAKYRFNLQATNDLGWTSLHTLCFQTIWRVGSPSIKESPIGHGFGAMVKGMIISGADPCAVGHDYITPSLIAIVFQPLCEPWFRALAELGINVEAVARHMFRCINTPVFRRLVEKATDYGELDGSRQGIICHLIHTISKELGSLDYCVVTFLETLYGIGIPLEVDESMFDEPQGSSLSSGSDFRSSTSYNATGPRIQLRKRAAVSNREL